MEKLSELTILDLQALTEGKSVMVSSTDNSAIAVHIENAVVIAEPDSGNDGKIILLKPETGCRIELDSDQMIGNILGNKNTIMIRFSNGTGGLDIEITGDRDKLIHPVTNKYAWKEQIHDDFVSRYEFINRTGVFVTPEHFDYIYDMNFKRKNVSVDEFVNHYEDKYSTCIQEVPLSGVFKYEVMDEDLSCMSVYDEVQDPNIWEIVNSLAVSYVMEQQSKWEAIEKCKSALQRSLDTFAKMQLVSKEALEYQS